MIQKILATLLPLILPLLLYYLYFLTVNRMAHKKNIDLQKAFLGTAPWLILFAIGLVLMGITLGIWGVSSGSKPGETYVPPSFENNQMAPGKFKTPQPKYLNDTVL